MTARFEIVRTDAPKPWHGRYAVNGRVVWTTPQLSRQVGVERAILSLAREFGYVDPRLHWNGDNRTEKILTAADPTAPWFSVLYLDERDPNRCDCGHPQSRHSHMGCLVWDETAGLYCECERAEGNATNGGATLVVGSDG